MRRTRHPIRTRSACDGSTGPSLALGVRIGATLFVTLVHCHKSTPPTTPDEVPKVDMPAASPPAVAPPPPVRLPDDADAVDRWLFVEKAKDGVPGGWATGSFDRQKNKLDIHTRDVRQFVIDISRIRIDWQRLVVLSIDGKNSELRRRDFSLLRFRLDDHGQWVVVEP
jgi:hypothetical protein